MAGSALAAKRAMLRFAEGRSPEWVKRMLIAEGGRARSRMHGKIFSA